jgi:hypothetical protein
VYGDGSANVDLVSGDYFFPFSFPLPHSIPSSFAHEFGNVRWKNAQLN